MAGGRRFALSKGIVPIRCVLTDVQPGDAARQMELQVQMMSSDMDRAPNREPSRTRVFTDDDGVQWEVTEVSGRSVPAARGERCLIFSSHVAIRRVWVYPDTWVRMSGPELLHLSWSR